jgi:capsular polysaccharide biosynthesis protein
LLAGLLVLGGGLAIIELLPTRYSTTSTLSFAPRSAPNISADVIELAANKYAVVARSTTSVNSAAAAASVTREELRDALSVSVEPTTANLDIAVSLPDSRKAATAANTIAAVVSRAAVNDRLIAGEITARADPAAAQTEPSRSLLRVVAVAAALLAAGWASFAARHVGRRQGEPDERS